MNINDLLHDTGAVGALSSQLGIDQATAQRGAAALMPHLAQGFQQPRVATPATEPMGAMGGLGGLGGGLGGLIGALGGGGLLDNVLGSEPTQVNKGNDILGSIFASKQDSREVAQDASTQSGVSPDLLKKMLPILAMAMAGYMAKKGGAGGGGLGGMLGSVLGGLGGR